MQPEREPDQTEDPRGDEIGQGYPEQGQPGTSPGEHTEEREDTGADGDDAPGTSTSEEGDAGQATGNPGAAGG